MTIYLIYLKNFYPTFLEHIGASKEAYSQWARYKSFCHTQPLSCKHQQDYYPKQYQNSTTLPNSRASLNISMHHSVPVILLNFLKRGQAERILGKEPLCSQHPPYLATLQKLVAEERQQRRWGPFQMPLLEEGCSGKGSQQQLPSQALPTKGGGRPSLSLLTHFPTRATEKTIGQQRGGVAGKPVGEEKGCQSLPASLPAPHSGQANLMAGWLLSTRTVPEKTFLIDLKLALAPFKSKWHQKTQENPQLKRTHNSGWLPHLGKSPEQCPLAQSPATACSLFLYNAALEQLTDAMEAGTLVTRVAICIWGAHLYSLLHHSIKRRATRRWPKEITAAGGMVSRHFLPDKSLVITSMGL